MLAASHECSGCTPALLCHASSHALNLPHTTMPYLQSPFARSLRTQKSHSVLKPPSPHGASSISGQLLCKASLSLLIDTSIASPWTACVQSPMSYNAPMAASHVHAQKSQMQFNLHLTICFHVLQSRAYFAVSLTWLSTPSTNTAVLRPTMPTSSSHAKVRLAIASVFGLTVVGKDKVGRALSPQPPCPSSTASSGSSH